MHGYLNWWMGGLALGSVAIFFRMLTGRTLGVSGSWRKVAFWKQERENDQASKAIVQDQDGAANALLAATLAEFGDASLPAEDAETKPSAPPVKKSQTVPWTAHLVFLFSLILGGFIWSILTGNFQLHFHLSAIHDHISGSFSNMSFMLLVGGFLVGMGTQMAGGCSSGHGLSGCSNLSWSSLVATGIFFTTAVVAANLIKAVM